MHRIDGIAWRFAGWLLIVCLAITSARPTSAQSVPLAPTPQKSIAQHYLETWTDEEGLPQNVVRALIQTTNGYLWIGTQEGIARFDGAQFKVYNSRTTTALSEDFIARVLEEDQQRQLWIGTENSGLYQFANGRFTPFGEKHGLSGQKISSVLSTRDGALWVGTYDAGLFKRVDSTFIPVGQNGANTSQDPLFVSALHETADGTVWVGTDEGLFVYSDTGLQRPAPQMTLPDAFISAIHEDRTGRIWVGTRQGLYRDQQDALALVSGSSAPQQSMIFALTEDVHGALWIGTDNEGLQRFYDGTFESFTADQGLAHNRVVALHQDREGSLWIGTEGGGLNQLRNAPVTSFTTMEGLSSNMTLAVHEAPDQSLWVGTEGAGVNRIQRDGSVTTYTTADGLSSGVVLSLAGSPDGTMWIGTHGGGLNRLRPGNPAVISTVSGLPSANIFALHRTPDGTLWVGTDAGLARYRDGSIETYTTEDGLTSNSISAILKDASGDLWVGTYNAGLHRMTDNDTFQRVAGEKQLGAGMVLALHEDAEGTLWIGTYGGGLARMRNNSITRFTESDGLFDDRVYQILEDASGQLWMGSNRGISAVARSDISAYESGSIESIPATTYGKPDGLAGEVNGGFQPAGQTAQDGRLWFPTDHGVAVLNPANLPRNTVAPPVIIENVIVDDRSAGRPESLTIQPGTEAVMIRFTAPSFVASSQVQFEYKLEGYNKEWHPTTQRSVTYTNLDPGEYTFRVRASNGAGVWNKAGAALRFEQAPHFYQTTWFYLLTVLGAVGGAFGAYRLRIRQMKARERELEQQVEARTHDLREEKERTEEALQATEQARRETEKAKAVIEEQAEQLRELDRLKTQFFNNLSHEFRTPLTLTIGPLENALCGLYGQVDGELKQHLQVTLRNARRLLRLINQILDFSKLESGKLALQARKRDLTSFVEGTVLSFTAFAMEQGVSMNFDGPDETIELYYDPEKLEKVLFNLISNAVKFTPEGGRIDVTLATPKDGDSAEIHVADTGTGIPEADLPHIFDRFRQVDGTVSRIQEGTGIGLALVKELVELHGGTVRVESEVGTGTEFIITLPTGRDHLDDDQIATREADEISDDDTQAGGLIEMVAANPDEWQSESAENEALPSAPHGAPLILVVDDNRDLREYVRSCLQPHYRVVEAADGHSGLDAAQQHHPDLILSDIMMPGMDGYAFCDAVKHDDDLMHTPLILLTAKASTEMKVEGLERGADDYMAKPFNADELLARIDNLLTLRAQERELKELNDHLEQKVEEQLQIILKEREAYEAKLRTEKERAEKAARLKSAILNNMSHEFRTPMTGILGYSEILLEETDAAYREFAEYIHDNGQRLMDTLNAVIDLAKLESAAMEPQEDSVDATQLLHSLTDAYAAEAAEKELEFRTKLPSEPLPLPMSAEALKRVMTILIDNAIKFTNEGAVDVSVKAAEDTVHLQVEDTGIGISEDFWEHLFEPFHQESMGADRDYEGNGLNLSIAKRLVELSGGEIVVQSTKGEGSVFMVTLQRDPRQTPEKSPPRSRTMSTHAPPAPQASSA